MATSSVRYISGEEVEKVLKTDDLLVALEGALGNFSRGEEGGVVQPVRSVVCVEKHNGFFGVMPAYSENDNVLACKLVSFYPENQDLPTHLATILLFDPSNGSLKAIMDGEVITKMRTAVASAVATKYLANPDSKILALLGAGAQARSHYQALTHLHQFDEVRIWSRSLGSAQKLAGEIGGKACSTAEEAVRGADIICIHTFAQTPVVKADWIKPGAHINGVGACRPDWQEIDPEIMRSSMVYVDSCEAANKEAGDIIMSNAEIYAEIGEVVNGVKKAQWEKTTVFKSLGMAVEDTISAKLVYEECCKAAAE